MAIIYKVHQIANFLCDHNLHFMLGIEVERSANLLRLEWKYHLQPKYQAEFQ